MAIKICFNNEIHRFSKLPVNLKALIDTIISTFHNQLPQSWKIYYIDEDGDKVTLSHDQDYQSLIESESQKPSASLKLYVEPTDGLGASMSSIYELIHDSQAQAQVSKPSQNIWEKKVVIDDQLNKQQQQQPEESKEVQPRACPQPSNKGDSCLSGNKEKLMHKAKHFLKKLSKKDLPEEKRSRVLEKLKKIEEILTPEERVEFEKKKREWEEKIAARKQLFEGSCQESEIMKAKQLIKRAKKGCPISEDEKQEILRTLNKVEESLTPEKKAIFINKKQKWEKILSNKDWKGFNRHDNIHAVKHVLKKLSKENLPEEKRERLSEKLKHFEEKMTPEERARFQEKKQKWQEKFATRKQFPKDSAFGGEMCKAKYLLKKVKKGHNILEEERLQILETINKIEQSLTPEQKVKFSHKIQKWQHILNNKQFNQQQEVVFQTDESGRPIHADTSCINCSTAPIVGIRYKCSVCHHFSFCEKCESTVDHPHAFLKLKNPGMAHKRFKGGFHPHDHHGHHKGGRHHFGNHPFKAFKTMKVLGVLTKISKTAHKGNTQKISKYHERYLHKLPQEVQQIIEPVFKVATTDNLDIELLDKTIAEVRETLLNKYHPEDKETVLQEWEQLQQKYSQNKEFVKKFAKKFSKRFTMSQVMMGEMHGKKKGPGMCKNFEEVREKALKMKEILVDEDLKRLCKFVARSPEGLSVEELITRYHS